MLSLANMDSVARPLLRFALVVLFLWFGLSQVTSPGDWIAWVPEWATVFGLSATVIVLLNGVFEVVLGVFLAAGFYTRVVALLLSLHLLFIAYEVGYNDIGVRDFALAVCTLSLALFGPDTFSLDNRFKKE